MELIWVFVAIAYWLAFATYALASSPFINQFRSRATDANEFSLPYDQLTTSANGMPIKSNRTRGATSSEKSDDVHSLLEDGVVNQESVHPQQIKQVNINHNNSIMYESTARGNTPLAQNIESFGEDVSANAIVSSPESSQATEAVNSDSGSTDLTPVHILPSSDVRTATDASVINQLQSSINKGPGEPLTSERDYEHKGGIGPDELNQKTLNAKNGALDPPGDIAEDADMGSKISIQELTDHSGSKDQEPTSLTQVQSGNPSTSELEWPALKPSEPGAIDDSTVVPETEVWPTITPEL